MCATVWRNHIIDLVVGNRRPFAVYLDFVMASDHAARDVPVAVEIGRQASIASGH
jgi:hypothetical protein